MIFYNIYIYNLNYLSQSNYLFIYISIYQSIKMYSLFLASILTIFWVIIYEMNLKLLAILLTKHIWILLYCIPHILKVSPHQIVYILIFEIIFPRLLATFTQKPSLAIFHYIFTKYLLDNSNRSKNVHKLDWEFFVQVDRNTEIFHILYYIAFNFSVIKFRFFISFIPLQEIDILESRLLKPNKISHNLFCEFIACVFNLVIDISHLVFAILQSYFSKFWKLMFIIIFTGFTKFHFLFHSILNGLIPLEKYRRSILEYILILLLIHCLIYNPILGHVIQRGLPLNLFIRSIVWSQNTW